MLTKEKRNKIIAGAIVLSLLTSVAAGCGSETEEQEENGTAATGSYPWWMFWHLPFFGGTTSNVRQAPPAPDANTGSAQTKVNSADGTKAAAPASKVQSPATGKTGISSGAARSSAVS